jgi:predicted amidohydrolase YtcJ
VVLERDPRMVKPDEIRNIRVMLTMIGGEVKYAA